MRPGRSVVSPRAAVFGFHDLVPAGDLDQVPVTHRPYVLTPEEFRVLMVAACGSRRKAVTVSRVPDEPPGTFYAITFDDGAASDHAVAFPVLRELGLRATFFIVPTLVGTPGFVTWPQLGEMVAGGMEIGSHSLTHPFVDRLDAAELRHEFGESKRILEERLGVPVRCASLPRGFAPPGLRPVLEDLGYRAFCDSRVAWWQAGGDPLAIPRVGVRRGMSPGAFAALVNAAPRSLWPLQAVDRVKHVLKGRLGLPGWLRLRRALLGAGRSA
jgi:peptidoglycan/xylan/chitin deacetylase (PgdA/CDA1 family)